MSKKLYIGLTLFILLILLSLIYLSIFGFKTEKFNSNISNNIKKVNKNLDIKLNNVNLILDLFKFKINAKTIGASLIYKNKEIQLESIKSNVSIKSLIKGEFLLTGINISTKSLEIKNFLSFIRLLKNDSRIFIAEQLINKGYLIADINIEFDEFGNVKKNYEINGFVKDGQINLLKKYNFDKIDFIFNIKNEDILLNEFEVNLNKKNFFLPQVLIQKTKNEFLISGKINNNSISLNNNDLKNFIDVDLFGLKLQNIEFNSKNDFRFRINKDFEIDDFNFNSKLNIKKIELNNFFQLKNIFPKVKDKILFENNEIEINYKKDDLTIMGFGQVLIQEEFDKIQYKISKKKNEFNQNTKLFVKDNSIKIDFLNFEKIKNSDLLIEISSKKKEKKDLVLNKILLKENDNQILINNLILSNNKKIKNVDSIEFNYTDIENFKNEITILKKNSSYIVKGESFNLNKIIEILLNSNNENNIKFFKKDLKFIFDIEKIYLDKNNISNNLIGNLDLKNDKIYNLNLRSKFSNNENIQLTIRNNEDQQTTTLFSNKAKPLVDRYKFIKGFNEGYLDFFSVKKNNQSKSTLKIYDFKLKELPNLTKILTLASLQGIADLLSGEGIRFTEFEMNFSNKDDLITIDEIYAIGPAISILMNGYIEKNRLISLRGTLVPATTINKTIGSIPVLGDILVGKKIGEGVFGVSFKIKGPPKKLETTVNPIKTLTPRFITRTLEKIKKN